jgi:hypothetical protein
MPQTTPTDHIPTAALKRQAELDAESMRTRQRTPTPADLADAATTAEATRPPSVVGDLRTAVALGQAGRLACPPHRVGSIVQEYCHMGSWARDGRQGGSVAMVVGAAGARLLADTFRPGYSDARVEYEPHRSRMGGEAHVNDPNAIKFLEPHIEEGMLVVLDASCSNDLTEQAAEDLTQLAASKGAAIVVVVDAAIGEETWTPELRP